MTGTVKISERVKPSDSLLRFVTYPGERQLAAVYADGRIAINWPMVKKLAAQPRPADDGLRATGWAIATLLIAARDRGRQLVGADDKKPASGSPDQFRARSAGGDGPKQG